MWLIIWILIAIIITPALALILFMFTPRRHPLPSESDYAVAKHPWWEFYYMNRYFNSVKGSVKGSGLEEYFRTNSFEFPKPAENTELLTISTVGDLMVRNDLVPPASCLIWNELADDLFNADFSIGNFEFTINPNLLFDKPIRFSFEEAYAFPLIRHKDKQFDLLTLGNNHLNDSYKEGTAYTCDFLDREGFIRVGANKTVKEQDEFPIVEVKGCRIAIFSYSFTHNGIPLEAGNEHGINLVRFNANNDTDYDPSIIYRHIERAKKRGADYIISCNHWGREFEIYPVPKLIERGHDLLERGVDMIIGHHPHILNPSERYRTKDGRDCIIFYSLGNTTTNSMYMWWQNLSQLAKINLAIDRSGNKPVLTPLQVTLIPFLYSYKKENDILTHRLIRLLDAYKKIKENQFPSHFSKKDIRRILKAYPHYHNFYKQPGIIIE